MKDAERAFEEITDAVDAVNKQKAVHGERATAEKGKP